VTVHRPADFGLDPARFTDWFTVEDWIEKSVRFWL
jgi:hypothetical protein